LTKDILIQYCDLLEEIKDLRKRIQSTKDKIKRLEDEGQVTDSVTCGKRGKKPLATVKITGFPCREYSRAKTLLQVREMQLQLLEINLLELTNQVEEYIQGIPSSRIRRIMRYVYLDDLTYIQTAHRMGGINDTPDGIRMELKRFLEKN
jgi:hypothetical protein